jgi:hypothetical protein
MTSINSRVKAVGASTPFSYRVSMLRKSRHSATEISLKVGAWGVASCWRLASETKLSHETLTERHSMRGKEGYFRILVFKSSKLLVDRLFVELCGRRITRVPRFPALSGLEAGDNG